MPITAMTRQTSRILLIVAALILLRGALPEIGALRTTVFESDADDFYGYYTAAWMVRNHQNPQIYDAALHNIDPTEEYADSGSVVAGVARAHGIPEVPLYDYPATLADLLVPLTYLSSTNAFRVWFAINLAAVVASAVVLSHILDLKSRTGMLSTLAFVLLFRPVLYCLAFSQVSTLLLFLLLAGIHQLTRERIRSSGLLFALAGAVKLTPLILMVPLAAGRSWKALRALVLWLCALVGVILMYNGLQAQEIYVLHELPRMGKSVIDPENRGLSNALEVLVYGHVKMAPNRGLQNAGTILAVVVLLVAVALCARSRKNLTSASTQFELLAAFLLLGVCIAPVSWLHAYTIGVPAALVGLRRIAAEQARPLEACLLLMFLLAASTAATLWLAMLTPIAGIALALVQLHGLGRSDDRARLTVQHQAWFDRPGKSQSIEP